MRTKPALRFFAALGLIGGIALADTAEAQGMRWPSETTKAKPAPTLADPPATLARPSKVAEKAAKENSKPTKLECKDGKDCVACVASCDGKLPIATPEPKQQSADASESVGSILYDSTDLMRDAGRGSSSAGGITCATGSSGCSVAGVYAPDTSYSYYSRFYGVRSSSRYID